ncbi:MAG: hypothetical protein R6V03_04410 [Kiritimatiellia bacterium]
MIRIRFRTVIVSLLAACAVAAVVAVYVGIQLYRERVGIFSAVGKSPEREPVPAPSGDSIVTEGTARADHTEGGGKEQESSANHEKVSWKSLRRAIAASAEKDPRATGKWATENLPRGGELSFALHTALWKWAGENPAEALRWADRSLSPDRGRECAFRVIFSAWARRNPPAAAARLQEVEVFRTKSLVTGEIAVQWAKTDLNEAVSWAWNLPRGPARVSALAGIVRYLPRLDAAEEGEIRGTTAVNSRVIRALASLIAEKELEDASAWIAGRIPGGPEPDPAFQIQLSAWTRSDPESAAEWALQLPEEHCRRHALSTVSETLAAAQPEAVESKEVPDRHAEDDDILENNTESGEITDEKHDEPVPEIPADVFLRPWGELIPLVEQLPDGVLRNGLVHKTAVDMGREDPATAAVWAAEQLPEGRALDTALRVIVWEWTVRDRESAVEWSRQAEEEKRRTHSLLTASLAASKSDPRSAAEILGHVPDGRRKSDAAGSIAFQWARRDAEAAREWAEGLSSQEAKESAIAAIERAEGN